MYDVKGEGEEVLADIISQQEQQAFLQEDNAKRVEESVERQFSEKKRVQIHLRSVSGMFVDPSPTSERFMLKVKDIICCRYY